MSIMTENVPVIARKELSMGTPVAALSSGLMGSVLGPVGPVSVDCDWRR